MDFEENQVPEAILDKLTKVCTCRSITRKTIKEAILNGAHTFPEVKEATRAGTGACGGKGCGPRIVKLLAEMKEQGKIPFSRSGCKPSKSLRKTGVALICFPLRGPKAGS